MGQQYLNAVHIIHKHTLQASCPLSLYLTQGQHLHFFLQMNSKAHQNVKGRFMGHGQPFDIKAGMADQADRHCQDPQADVGRTDRAAHDQRRDDLVHEHKG